MWPAIGRYVVSFAAEGDLRLEMLTGCLLMTQVENLHEEAKVIPVFLHNHILSLQYLLGCYRESHSYHHIQDSAVVSIRFGQGLAKICETPAAPL